MQRTPGLFIKTLSPGRESGEALPEVQSEDLRTEIEKFLAEACGTTVSLPQSLFSYSKLLGAMRQARRCNCARDVSGCPIA
eukprot:754838-Hanusia_phi.AAC.1